MPHAIRSHPPHDCLHLGPIQLPGPNVTKDTEHRQKGWRSDSKGQRDTGATSKTPMRSRQHSATEPPHGPVQGLRWGGRMSARGHDQGRHPERRCWQDRAPLPQGARSRALSSGGNTGNLQTKSLDHRFTTCNGLAARRTR